jgi:hypothetical protein
MLGKAIGIVKIVHIKIVVQWSKRESLDFLEVEFEY